MSNPIKQRWPWLIEENRAPSSSDAFADFGAAEHDFRVVGRKPTKCLLISNAILRVHGEDARSFLHGQFTADIEALKVGQTLLTAWCSPKGRVLFLVRVIADENGFWLLFPTTQADLFLKRLRLYILRSQVAIDDCSASHVVVLMCTQDHSGLTSASAIGDGRCWWITTDANSETLWSQLNAEQVGEPAIKALDIREGLPSFPSALADKFLPQELNLDQTSGLSFNKGCYPGQEIIARVKFRGSVKRRLTRLIGAIQECQAGNRLLAMESTEHVGTVLCSQVIDQLTVEALAVLDTGQESVVLEGGSTQTPLKKTDFDRPSFG